MLLQVFGSSVIGFALPVAIAAGLVQLLTYRAARPALLTINHNIPQGKVASGIFPASRSSGVGILLNAGCIA